MSAHSLRTDELRTIIRLKGFRVKALAVHLGLDVRTLHRRFREQLQISPKAWLQVERMNSAPPLLADGLSNKEVAASLDYCHESNFCRHFKQRYGCAPQTFSRSHI
jgi:AraC-like DNA-binding protein